MRKKDRRIGQLETSTGLNIDIKVVITAYYVHSNIFYSFLEDSSKKLNTLGCSCRSNIVDCMVLVVVVFRVKVYDQPVVALPTPSPAACR